MTTVSVVAALSLFAPSAQADLNRNVFELDKNATSTAGGQPAASDDWDDVYSLVTADSDNIGDDDKCIALGAVECAFAADPQVNSAPGVRGDNSIFTTGGSKDDLDIPNWRWSTGSVPDADEILNAYAIKYDVPGTDADSGQMLYFGADRYAVNGTKDFGFWFFHEPVSQNTDGTFEGEHTGNPTLGDDDILILGTFTQGGATATVRVFRWVGTGGNATANGTVTGPVDAFGDCVPSATGADGCNTVNDQTTDSGGWEYVGKQKNLGTNKIAAGGFVEGGIDLSDLGLEGCFSSFIAETRSAASVDAQLKDFVLGQFEACGSTTTTTPKEVSGSVGNETYSNIPADGVSIGTDGSVRVADEASVVVTGTSTYGGSVSFRLCGPTPLSDANYTLCTPSTGVVIGSAKAVSGPSPSVVHSDETTVTSAGRYCWFAAYSGDSTARVPGSSDNAVTECFKVLPVRPTLDTDAGDGPVDFGQAVTDTATLTGTAKQPGTNGLAGAPSIGATNGADAGGTITFSLYGPDSCSTLAAGFATAHPNGIQRTVTGDGTYPKAGQDTVSYTPTAPGTYYWKASYGGNAPNTLESDSDLNTAGQQAHNADCSDTDEAVVVRQIPTQIQSRQSWYPNDTATITSSVTGDNLGAGGSVVFGLYDNATCTDTNGADPGGLFYTETESITGGQHSETVSTSNTTVPITTLFADPADSEKAYSWKIVYTPAASDTAHTGIQSACHAEHFSIKYTNDNGPGTDLP